MVNSCAWRVWWEIGEPEYAGVITWACSLSVYSILDGLCCQLWFYDSGSRWGFQHGWDGATSGTTYEIDFPLHLMTADDDLGNGVTLVRMVDHVPYCWECHLQIRTVFSERLSDWCSVAVGSTDDVHACQSGQDICDFGDLRSWGTGMLCYEPYACDDLRCFRLGNSRNGSRSPAFPSTCSSVRSPEVKAPRGPSSLIQIRKSIIDGQKASERLQISSRSRDRLRREKLESRACPEPITPALGPNPPPNFCNRDCAKHLLYLTWPFFPFAAAPAPRVKRSRMLQPETPGPCVLYSQRRGSPIRQTLVFRGEGEHGKPSVSAVGRRNVVLW
nr:hypothetical protein CFP56_22227 [Quercus suber]